MQLKNQLGKISQPLMIGLLLLVTLLIAIGIWFSSKDKTTDEHAHAEHEESEHADEPEAEKGHAEEGEIQLTAQQLTEQGIQIASAQQGVVSQVTVLPGKLVVNTDQQAHISPNFGGHVEQVNVELGQNVQKGQTLAVLSVPELIDQQANLRMAHASLDLARQDYQREQQLWSQGISAKQDYQRAENAYRQAQITVQSVQSRLNALGATGGVNGRFAIKAPISGVISQKDIVVGENVQLADQLFVIEQFKELWLEFNLPAQYSGQLQANQSLTFKPNASEQKYEAIIQSLTSQADAQTGRLVVRPNVLVNIFLDNTSSKTALRVHKSAIQNIEGQTSVFVVDAEQKGQVHLKAQPIQLGQASNDAQWLEVISGLTAGQRYVSQGSFVLKSELEKGEADHAH